MLYLTVLLTEHSLPNLFHNPVFLRVAILSGVRPHLTVVLIFISLVVPDAENLSVYLLAIGVCSFEKCLFHCLAYFLMDCFYLCCLNSLHVLDFNPCWIYVLQNFLQFYWLPFHSIDCFLCCIEAFVFAVVPLSYFFLSSWWSHSPDYCQKPFPMSLHVQYESF